MLTVLSFSYIKNHKTYVECLCDCGKTHITTMNGLLTGTTTSCGCRASKGEAEILQYLQRNNIPHDTQKTFPDLKGPGGGALRFDFILYPDEEDFILIEFQGYEHYYDTSRWHKNFGTQQREVTDQMKRDYCLKNNIKLIEIPYFANVEKRLDEVLKERGDAA